MGIPPLDHRIHGSGPDVITLGKADRVLHAIDDMEHGDHENESTEEPVGDIDVRGVSFRDRAKEHDGVGNPNHRDQNINRPFQFCIFVRSCHSKR